jgi:hypothetical protein
MILNETAMSQFQSRAVRNAIATILFVVIIPASARAAVVFSNLGPSDSYGINFYAVHDRGPQDVAMPFTVGAGPDYTFTSLEMALLNLNANPSLLSVHLMTDAGGLPGAIIESMSLAVTPGSSLVTGVSALTPTLTAGTTYWIATDAGPGFNGGWHWTSPPVSGTGAFSDDHTATWTQFSDVSAAFRVNGDPITPAVPEPGSMSLFGCGLLIFMGYRVMRRNRHI